MRQGIYKHANAAIIFMSRAPIPVGSWKKCLSIYEKSQNPEYQSLSVITLVIWTRCIAVSYLNEVYSSLDLSSASSQIELYIFER